MAVVIGRGQAHGHDLPPEVANELQERLDAGVRHWTVRFARGGWRRNLEVLEGERGIWRVRPVEGELVELAPTSTTAVVRELIALLLQGVGRDGERAGPRPHDCGPARHSIGLSGEPPSFCPVTPREGSCHRRKRL